MKIKVVFNEVTRRWRSSEDEISFDNLVTYVKKNWVHLPAKMGLTFVDEEGDQITITNDADLEEALNVAHEDCRTSLKISVIDLLEPPADGFVVLGGEVSQSEDSDEFDAEVLDEAEEPLKVIDEPVTKCQDINDSIEEPVAAPVNEAGEPMRTEDTHMEQKTLEPTDNSSKHIDLSEQKEEEPTEEPSIDLKAMANDFFKDTLVEAALPGIVDVLFNALRAGDELRTAIDLALASFPDVMNHKFIQTALPFLPAYLPRITPVVPFLLLLGPEAAKKSIEGLKQVVTKCFNTACGVEKDIDISSIMKKCCPNMINLMESGLRNGQEQLVDVTTLLNQFGLAMPDLETQAAADLERREEAEAREAGLTVHTGITCDGCDTEPIVGARFKSAVIPDFDLCESCVGRGVDAHPKEYPMIKMNTSMQDMLKKDMQMKGLREFMCQFRRGRWGGRCGGRGRGFGGRGRGRFGGRGGGCPWRRWAQNGRSETEWAAEKAAFWKKKSEWFKNDSEWAAEQANCGKGDWAAKKAALWKQKSEKFAEKAAQWERSSANPANQSWEGAHPGAEQHGWRPVRPRQCEERPTYNMSAAPVAPHARPDKHRAAFIADVTIPDRSICAPAQTLVKTWKMRNTGKTAWEGVCLEFIKGEPSLIPDFDKKVDVGAHIVVAQVGKVLAGQAIDVSTHINTPKGAGRYTAYFRLMNQFQERFGPKIWVDIVVQKQQDGALQKAINESLKDLDKPTRKMVMKQEKLERKIAKQSSRLQKIYMKPSKSEIQAQKKAMKLSGLQRKLAKKEMRLAKMQAKTEQMKKMDSNEKNALYVKKLEKQLAKANDRAENISRKIADAKADANNAKEAPCSIVNHSVPVEQEEQKVEVPVCISTEQPTEQPAKKEQEAPVFKYHEQFVQVQHMGFATNPDVVRCLLVENKGDVTKVINTLLSSMS